MRLYTNPVHDAYFADPFAWRAGGEFYAIGTGPSEASGTVASRGGPSVFPLLRSRDFVEWEPAGRALVRPAESLGDTFWAPEIAHAQGRWWLYYSVGFGDRQHQLRVAVGESPLGPYLDCAQLTDPGELPFAIDPHPFRDVDGRWYLFFARDFLEPVDERGNPARCGTALAVCALESMTKIAPGTIRTVARARHEWQRFAKNRPMYGRVFDWHTLEGPFVVQAQGRYWCIYSGGCWQQDSYGVDYVWSESVLGPYVDDGVEAGPRVLRTVPDRVLGPGHCSVCTGPDGHTPYVVYHAWDPPLTARRMCIDPLRFTPEGPRCDGPTWAPQPIEEAVG